MDPALLDTLVPLKNRRAFDEEVSRLLSEAKAAGEPMALIRFDIDDFKRVNDEHGGHAIGDEALREVAQRADACVRRRGTAYRVGGDEFVLVLPNHTAQEAIAFAERLRAAVHDNTLTSRSLTLTVSVGIAVFPEHGASVEDLNDAADRAAYNAKDLGKNLVRLSGELTEVVAQHEVERRQPEPGPFSRAVVVRDGDRDRFFSWRDRDSVHLIAGEEPPKQLLDFASSLCDMLRQESGKEPEFNAAENIRGEIVYELSQDFRAKWRLLGGMADKPGKAVLVLTARPARALTDDIVSPRVAPEPKWVSSNYATASGLQQRLESEGYVVTWSTEDKLNDRLAEGL